MWVQYQCVFATIVVLYTCIWAYSLAAWLEINVLLTYLLTSESLDIERRHMAALTWDAMFKSRRAAILAEGGGGI